MAKKKVVEVEVKKIIDVEVVEHKEASAEKKVRDLSKVPLTEAAKALEAFNSAPDAEDLLFKNMSKENRKKYGLSLSTEQLEERHIGSRHSMNENRIEYALSSSRLIARQAWREPDKNGKIYPRTDYFEKKLGDSYSTVERHHKAVLCLTLMGADPSNLHLYKYRRLAAFYDKIEKNVATQDDFKVLDQKMMESPENPVDILTDKEFDNEMKQRFGQREAEMKALQDGDDGADPMERMSFEVPSSQKQTVLQAHRLAMDIAKEENREAPSLGAALVEAVSHWMLQVNQGQKLMAAERARQLFQEAYGLALIPFKVHKFQTSPQLKDLPHIRIFQVGDYFMLEEEPRYVAKKLGVKVEQIKEVHLNVGAYLLRTGVMTIDNEDIRKSEEVLTKSFKGAKKMEEPEPEKKGAKRGPKKKAEDEPVAEAAEETPDEAVEEPVEETSEEVTDEKPEKKKKKKLSELTDNEISVSITKVKKDIGMSEDEYKELADGKDPRKILRELLKLQKAST